MEFNISVALRNRLRLDDSLFRDHGRVVFNSVHESRTLAHLLNSRKNEVTDPAELKPDATVHASQLFAMGLINELNHAMVERYRKDLDPQLLTEALRWFSTRHGKEETDRLLLAFTVEFPATAVRRRETTAEHWLSSRGIALPNRETALEELFLFWLANINPAFARFKEFFDDTALRSSAAYQDLDAHLDDFLETRPQFSSEAKTLLDALRAPMLASPDSLSGQLDYIREHWEPYLGPQLSKTLLAIDVLREEEVAIWKQFHPPTGKYHEPAHAEGWNAEGFQGDEYVGFEGYYDEIVGSDGVLRRVRRDQAAQYAADYQAPLNEFEAFSSDQAWMPTVVLMAKSTYVWLEQLSQKYLRHIHRLDQIPLDELRLLADRGITGLWLIGLWERSKASQTIKRLRGQADAVASAYSLMDYHIAEDLGGDAAYQVLRDQAASVGLRLASDMVPNHMGIDSTWVIEHPEWFLRRSESPFPVYQFEGPDLSTDPRVEIKIEDHYYDQSDAAVVFRLRQRSGDGRTDYVYHGNDGTTFAWNDTAQLDYSQAAVREHVIQVILQVARQFPIIRFDAAMVLAKRHVQRLWFPLPGVGGSIPSRAEDAMSQDDFDRMMPHEFWREVVDRVAVEVPGTLLLAEAFWLLEGYFVRTLGMHRVYNSAFMVMLRDEENAKFRSYLKKTIEFDPDILKRYVNFMSNPDERTAINQFGSGDKFFGVATMMATIPGLPMFAHGQVEGFTERYGMEFKQARTKEWPNESLIARHQYEIAPLLKRRALFAESENFVLYDFWTDHGSVDENVFAYTNRLGGERGLVLYNNSYSSTSGTIHLSVADMDKRSGQLRQRRLTDALALPRETHFLVAYLDKTRNLEYLRRASDFDHHGLTVNLRGYQYMVLLDWRMLRDTAEQPWGHLCDVLNGAGVYNLNEALSQLRLRPLSEAIRQASSAESVRIMTNQVSDPGSTLPENALAPLLDRGMEVFWRWQDIALPSTSSAEGGTADDYRKRLSDFLSATVRVLRKASVEAPTEPSDSPDPLDRDWTLLLSWAVLRALTVGTKAKPEPDSKPAEGIFEQLQLRASLAEIFSQAGINGEGAWQATARLRILLNSDTLRPTGDQAARFWNDPDVGWLIGVNEYEGVRYLDREKLANLLRAIQWIEAIEFAANPAAPATTMPSEILLLAKSVDYKLDELPKRLAPEKEEDDIALSKSVGEPANDKAVKAKTAAVKTVASKTAAIDTLPSVPTKKPLPIEVPVDQTEASKTPSTKLVSEKASPKIAGTKASDIPAAPGSKSKEKLPTQNEAKASPASPKPTKLSKGSK